MDVERFDKLMRIEDRMMRATDPQKYRELERERFLIMAGKDEEHKGELGK